MKKFPVADGIIEKLICNRNTLIMEFTDWQERRWEITFNDLVAFQGLGAVGTELCDMYEEENTWLSQEATRLEPGETGTTYCFTSSNGGETILRVVAGSYSVQEI